MMMESNENEIEKQLRKKRLAELGGGCSLLAISAVIALMPSKSPDLMFGMLACGIIGAFALVLAYRITRILKAMEQKDPNNDLQLTK